VIGLVERTRQRVSHFVKKWEKEAPARRFMAWCRRKWPHAQSEKRDSVVLLGLFDSNPSIFCTAYVANFLAEKHHSRIESYQFIGRVNPTVRKIYESFGARFGLGMGDAAPHEARAQAEAEQIFAGLKSKWDVMKLTVDGVLIGDQVYDSYLRFYNEATVRLDDPRLREVLVQALRIFYTTRDYLARNRVTAFFADDFSYINSGIVTRLVHLAGVPIYMVLFGKIFWILRAEACPTETSHTYPAPAVIPYFHYPRMFAALSPEQQAAGIARGKTALEERLAGKFCPLVRMAGSSYTSSGERVLDDGPEPRVLVMMHDFVDSPHGYREMLFPDFYEWIVFLLEHAEKTPFRWYVKPHPCTTDPSRAAMNAANDRVVAELKARFPKVTFLPANASNRQILDDGLAAMFTVHGTSGHEYAYRGVPVVNCGDNPHIAYNFNLHARTLEQYAQWIREADRLPVQIEEEAIEQFFFMHYFHLAESLAAPVNPIDERLFAQPDWGTRQTQPAIFDDFMAGATPDREHAVAKYLEQYFGGQVTTQLSTQNSESL
jgi:hypothetical protein